MSLVVYVVNCDIGRIHKNLAIANQAIIARQVKGLAVALAIAQKRIHNLLLNLCNNNGNC